MFVNSVGFTSELIVDTDRKILDLQVAPLSLSIEAISNTSKLSFWLGRYFPKGKYELYVSFNISKFYKFG